MDQSSGPTFNRKVWTDTFSAFDFFQTKTEKTQGSQGFYVNRFAQVVDGTSFSGMARHATINQEKSPLEFPLQNRNN